MKNEKVVWIDEELHKRIADFLKKNKNFKIMTIKQFCNLAILEKLEREK